MTHTYCPHTGKRGYDSRDQATAQRQSFLRSPKFRVRPGKMSAYKCRKCAQWHLGNTP